MNNKLITVGIALYNNQDYIERCLESVINQTYNNIEILVVDDGSTDNSIEKVKDIVDARIVLITKENNGLSSVRQKCLEHAKGEYICFIDGDDYLRHDYLQTLYDSITINKADIAICGTVFLSETGEEIEEASNSYSFRSNSYINVDKDNLQTGYCKLLNDYFMSDSWNKLYLKEFLLKENVKFELPKGFNGTDLIFNHKILLHEPKIAVLEKKLYIHVIYKKSATHRKKKDLLGSMLLAIDQIVKESKCLGIYMLMKNQIANLFYLLVRNAIQDLFLECEGNRKEFIASLRTVYVSLKKFSRDDEGMKMKKSISVSLRLFSVLLSLKWSYLIYIYCCLSSCREKNV